MKHQTIKVSAMGVVMVLAIACSKTDNLELLEKVPAPLQALDKFTLVITDYCPEFGTSFINYFVRNTNMIFEDGELRSAFAGDGISDRTKVSLFGGKRRKDTPRDGYSDFLVAISGISDIIGTVEDDRGELPECSATLVNGSGEIEVIVNYEDSDRDGLTDCEEDFLNTDPQAWDSDGDMISDYLAVLHGMNPLDGNQALQKLGDDNYTNFDKVRLNIPINEAFRGNAAASAYDLRPPTARPDLGDTCADFRTENIPLNVDPALGFNLVKLYFVVQEGSNLNQKVFTIPVPSTIPNGDQLTFNYGDLNED